MLSNTAVPKYYGEFRQRVIRGEIPVCETIALQMKRIDDLIANPGVYYDDEAVEGWIRYCENELTLTDGDNLHLLDYFKLWGEDVYGWYYYEPRSIPVRNLSGRGIHYETRNLLRRLTTKQFIIVPRGAAKSVYASTHQSYFLNEDTHATHQVTTAPTMKQAEEILLPIRVSINRARGPFFKFLTDGSLQNTTGKKINRQRLAVTKKGVENFLNGSLLEIRPMSISKLQGLQCKCATVDEWLSGDCKEDVIGCLEQSCMKVDGSLLVALSSEGTVRNGVGDSVKMELMQILKGEYIAPHVSIWWYKLDNIDEINHPEIWIKANPALGQIVSYSDYQKEVERAEKNPAVRNDILAKRFNLPMEGYTYYFTYDETLRTNKRLDFRNCACSMGADLSRGDDFCAFTFLFPLNRGNFGVKTINFISERTYNVLPLALHEKYKEFINEGSLIVMPGSVLEMDDVYDILIKEIERRKYDVRCVGYDPYNASKFIDLWITDNSPYCVEKVVQGAKTESVPLGELKILAEDKALLFDESMMQFTMGNCIALTDTNGNRKLYKRRNDEKIDAVAAMMDAYVSYKLHKEEFA